MKKVEIDYTYTVFCYKTIEVPDDFTFESIDPDDMVDEIEFDAADIDVKGVDVGAVEYDGIRSVEVDGECYMN